MKSGLFIVLVAFVAGCSQLSDSGGKFYNEADKKQCECVETLFDSIGVDFQAEYKRVRPFMFWSGVLKSDNKEGFVQFLKDGLKFMDNSDSVPVLPELVYKNPAVDSIEFYGMHVIFRCLRKYPIKAETEFSEKMDQDTGKALRVGSWIAFYEKHYPEEVAKSQIIKYRVFVQAIMRHEKRHYDLTELPRRNQN